MGLDMYALKVKAEDAIDDLTIRSAEDGGSKSEEIAYWRKHHDLHGWMRKLFEMKGGTGDFNCQPVRLTEDDLFELEQDVRRNDLPQTTGFFFGDNPPDAESIEQDIKFIVKAREAIAEGYAVYYDSWW
jgi:hypothetical protein